MSTHLHRCHALIRPTRLMLCALVALLAACATPAPPPTDGPQGGVPPLDPMQVPDARPVLEPIRPGGPNKPYAVLGETYTPLPAEATLSERGLASWYGRQFHGRRTASGELYNMYAMTAAHRTLPLPSFARVSNPANGRSVIVRINDRGPFMKGRVIDLSYSAAQRLGVVGLAEVEVVRITADEIRRGAWQAPAPTAPSAAAAVVVAPVIDGDEPPLPARADAPPTPPPSRGHWVQLGAFRDRKGAEQLQARAGAAVEGIGPMLTMFNENALYRVQAGPFESREQAQRMAERLRDSLSLVPVLVERK